MSKYIWRPALALGAVLAASSAVGADDVRLTGTSGTTMTLGGKGTAEQAATEDNELARGYHGGYGGYRGGYGYGGYGYRGGYGYSSFYRGYGGGYGGYYGGYRGYYGGYYRPAYYAPRYYYPSYYGGGYGGYYPGYSSFYYSSPGFGFSIGIGGDSVSAAAPVVPLGGLSVPQPMTPPAQPGDGTFRYDGGPAVPVPQPKADPQPIPPAGTLAPADLPISLKPKAATSPYKYKAYGEK